MKLAEALAARADSARRVEQLRSRLVDNARYQEGDEPAEDATVLLAEADTVLDELESLIRRINRTNAATPLGVGTLTDAIARRDVLRQRHSVLTATADAASGAGVGRQLRSELRWLSSVPVAEVRRRADDVAREIRTIDVDIQRTNWEVDLLD